MSAYDEAIEKMARAMYAEHANQRAGMVASWGDHAERFRESVRKEARAAAEAIGLREMMEALERANGERVRAYHEGYSKATNDHGITMP